MILYILLYITFATRLSDLLNTYPTATFTNRLSGNTHEIFLAYGLKIREVKRMLSPYLLGSQIEITLNSVSFELSDETEIEAGFSYWFLNWSTPRQSVIVLFLPRIEENKFETTEIYFERGKLDIGKLKKILGERFKKPYWNMQAYYAFSAEQLSNSVKVSDVPLTVFQTYPN